MNGAISRARARSLSIIGGGLIGISNSTTAIWRILHQLQDIELCVSVAGFDAFNHATAYFRRCAPLGRCRSWGPKPAVNAIIVGRPVSR
jgi:hypothetical protein